jgi:hypothetical protein
MSVICDLQLDVVGVGILLTFDSGGPLPDRMQSKRISPLFPFLTFDRGALPLQMPRDLRDRETPLTCDTIASLNLDTINFLHKVGFKLRFPDLVA